MIMVFCFVTQYNVEGGKNFCPGYGGSPYQPTRSYKPEDQNMENQNCSHLPKFPHPGLDNDFYQQDRQYTYNVTLRRFHETIVAVEKC
jgi:hypothetical protein